jgi:hypothetical protein
MEWFDRMPATDPLESGLAVELLRPYGLCPSNAHTRVIPMELA